MDKRMIWKQGQAAPLGFVVNKSAGVYGFKIFKYLWWKWIVCGGSGLFAEGLECFHTTMKLGDDLVQIVALCAEKIRAGTITST